GLATYPITSSVELFGGDGRLVSRFAFNLPDDLNAVPTSEEGVCTWAVFEEVSPFFAVERRVLSASRAVCVNDQSGASHVVGSIVVHALLDYANLPFIASKSPYVELLRPAEPQRTEGVSGGDIEFAVYALPLVTSNYVAGQMRANVEQEAVRTASAAQRVVEDLVAPRAAQQGVGIDDNLMVWVSRLIDQDVNIFTGARLLATSERNL